jgi:glutamate dehydrogenase (NAD(P)+)
MGELDNPADYCCRLPTSLGLTRMFLRMYTRHLNHDVDDGRYGVITGRHLPGVITGKPVPLFGSLGRGDATARGGICTVREAAKALGLQLQGATAAVQGYGNAGQFAHLLGRDLLGLKVMAVSDSKGGVYSENGIEYEKAVAWKEQTGGVVNLPAPTA